MNHRQGIDVQRKSIMDDNRMVNRKTITTQEGGWKGMWQSCIVQSDDDDGDDRIVTSQYSKEVCIQYQAFHG